MEKRPRSSRPPWKGGRGLTSNDLHDLAKPRGGLSSLTTYEPLSKSAVEFRSASREVVRRASKQAWAPPVQQSLSSSSDRFRGETPLPPHPSTTFTRAMREFGRVRTSLSRAASFKCTPACVRGTPTYICRLLYLVVAQMLENDSLVSLL